MMRKTATLMLVLACAAHLAAAEQAYTSQYDVGGLKVEAGFVPDKTEIAAGEPMFISFFIRNLADTDVGLPMIGDRAPRSAAFSITAMSASGHPVKDALEDNRNFGGIGSVGTIAPSETATYRLFLPMWLDVPGKGTYTVSCRTTLQLIKPDTHGQISWGDANKVEIPIATDFELTVAPRTSARATEIIYRFGQGVSSDDWATFREAILALSSIPDERVIPYLVSAIARGDFSEYEVSAWRQRWISPAINRSYPTVAIEGLGRFRNDEAVTALLAVLKNMGDPSARSAAAAALAATRCQSATPALLDTLATTDTYYLQEAAAKALAEIGDRSAVEGLKSHLTTPDMRARLAVVKALFALGEPFNEDWARPIIMSKSPYAFGNAVWFVRRSAGWDAARILAGCLDWDDASTASYYNYTILWQISACGGPKLTYNHDFDGKATDAQLEENRKTLDTMKAWLATQSPPR